MNFLGVSFSPPVPETVPVTPEGAPSRPGKENLFATPLLALPIALLAFVLNFHPIIGAVGWLGMVAAFVVPYRQWRHYERIGWYERCQIVTPELPFEMRGFGHRILFGMEGITFSSLLMPDQTIRYSEIVAVTLDCEGRCLKGVILCRATKPYYGANEPKPPQASFLISDQSDKGDGERTRVSLAILRAKAPQATFTGPKWVEQGWKPRLGFSRPSSPNGPGGGP